MDISSLLPLLMGMQKNGSSNNMLTSILPELLKNNTQQNPMQSLLMSVLANNFQSPRNTTNNQQQTTNASNTVSNQQNLYKTPFGGTQQNLEPPTANNFPPYQGTDSLGNIVNNKTCEIKNVYPESNLEPSIVNKNQSASSEECVLNQQKKEENPPLTTPFGYNRVY